MAASSSQLPDRRDYKTDEEYMAALQRYMGGGQDWLSQLPRHTASGATSSTRDTPNYEAPAAERANQYASDYTVVPADEVPVMAPNIPESARGGSNTANQGSPNKQGGDTGNSGNRKTETSPQAGGGREWWRTGNATDDAGDETSAQGTARWAGDAMPDSWLAEIRNFSATTQSQMQDAYDQGDESAFQRLRDEGRNQMYGRDSYADRDPGYAYADSDVGPRDLQGLGVPADWISEIEGWSPEDQDDWVRAIRAGDEESGKKVRDRARGK
jgi:hypothetical protein